MICKFVYASIRKQLGQVQLTKLIIFWPLFANIDNAIAQIAPRFTAICFSNDLNFAIACHSYGSCQFMMILQYHNSSLYCCRQFSLTLKALILAAALVVSLAVSHTAFKLLSSAAEEKSKLHVMVIWY